MNQMLKWEDVENKKVSELNLPSGSFVGYCPVCGRKLIVKNGKFGAFIGCTGYKACHCRKTYNVKQYTIRNYDAIADIVVESEKREKQSL